MGCFVSKPNKVDDNSRPTTPSSRPTTPSSRPTTPYISNINYCWSRPGSGDSDKGWEKGTDGLSPD